MNRPKYENLNLDNPHPHVDGLQQIAKHAKVAY